MPVLWRTAAIGLAVLLVLLISAILALVLVDWNAARGRAESFLSAAAGREVRVGHLDVEPGWSTTRVVLRDLSIANAEWGGERPLATIAELRLAVATWPLIRGRIALPDVVLKKPEILAEVAEDGRANWDLGAGAEAAGDVAAPEERSEFPYVGQLTVEDGTLGYRDAERGLDLEGTVATATGETRGNIEIALEGSLEDRELSLSFAGASLPML